jgi:hypothetical protein
MAMFSNREREILEQLNRQLEQTALAISNLSGTTQDQIDSSREISRNLEEQRSALERDTRDVRGPSNYGDTLHEAAEAAYYGEGEDPREVGGRARSARRSRRDEPQRPRVSSGRPPTGGSADTGGAAPPPPPPNDGVRTAEFPDDEDPDVFNTREDPRDEVPDEIAGQQQRPGLFTPEQVMLRQRANILDSRRANYARTLWFGNKPTAQQMAWILSERSARLAFETEPDPNNPDERVPIYMQPGVAPARTPSGALIRNQYGQVVSASQLAELGDNPSEQQIAGLAGAQTTSRLGVPITRQGNLAQVGGALGGASRFLSSGATMIPEFATYTAALAFARGIQQAIYSPGRAGLQMGYEQSITGAGARNFLEGRFDALREAQFGFNPWLSIGQAMQINRAIEGIGYRGDQRNAMVNSFARLDEQGLNVQDYIGMFNNDYRYGGANLSEFVNTLRQVPSAAQSANMNVRAFTQQLTEVSQTIAQRSGVSATNIAGQLTAISQGTGMTPALAGAQIQDQFLTIMGAARYGERLGTYLADPRRSVYQTTEGIEQKFQMLTGQSLSKLPTDSNLQALVREINFVQPNAFGMDFQQLMQYALDPKRNQATVGTNDLNQIVNNLIPFTNGRTMLAQGNQLIDVGSQSGREQVNRRIGADLERAGVSQNTISQIINQYGGGTSAKDIQNEIRKAQRAVTEVTNDRVQNANNRTSVIVGLDPRARSILTTTLKNADYEELQNPNGNNSFWSDVGDVAGTVAGRPIGAAVSAVDTVTSGFGVLG